MNKIDTQRNFIERLKYVLKTNPNTDEKTFSNFVYSDLIRLYIKEEYNVDLANEFKDWDEYFSNIEGINAFFDPNWKPFYQFTNKPEQLNIRTAIKLYIPLDYEHINKGVKDLFNYIAHEDIVHCSKVRRKISLDNVVIRVNNIYDAEKIINYVNTNQYIQDGLIKPNPFLIDKDNIAVAIDGYSTYNGYLTELLSKYIYNHKNNLEKVSLEGFEYFISEINKNFKKYSKDINNDNSNIIKLSLKSINRIGSYEEFKQYAQIREHNNENNLNKKDVLNDAINTLIKKYGVEIAIKHVEKYIETGNITLFSRDNNTRENARMYLNQEIVKSIVNEQNSTKEYVDVLMNLDYDKKKIEILETASKLTYKKYGESYPNQLISAITQVVTNNNYARFTNDNDARTKLKLNIKQEEMIEIIKRHLNENYINYDESNIEQIINLYNNDIINKTKEQNKKY